VEPTHATSHAGTAAPRCKLQVSTYHHGGVLHVHKNTDFLPRLRLQLHLEQFGGWHPPAPDLLHKYADLAQAVPPCTSCSSTPSLPSSSTPTLWRSPCINPALTHVDSPHQCAHPSKELRSDPRMPHMGPPVRCRLLHDQPSVLTPSLHNPVARPGHLTQSSPAHTPTNTRTPPKGSFTTQLSDVHVPYQHTT
jgi:hypothetical protein